MKFNLNCSQVAALISYYIEGKLNPALKKSIELHLNKCHNCNEKFEELKNILSKYEELKHQKSNNNEINETFENKEFLKNLSAYIDNELDSGENIKIKKITISNPYARKKLESMYKFQKLMHYAYEKTKSENKTDYSKNIIATLTNNQNEYTTTYFKKIAILFIIIIICIITGFLYLYF